jgi:predicted RNA-binding Zn-ribbon protein involved in translation (DUF1610 family)
MPDQEHPVPEIKEITILTVENELHTCPDCGYTLGFHTSFINANVSRDNPIRSTREIWRVILICPECGARYDVGWRVSFAESMNRFTKVPFDTVACVPHGKPAACLPPPHDHHQPE